MKIGTLEQPELFELRRSEATQIVSSGIRPFLKWAGGKSRLLPTLREKTPKTFGNYFEPFLGGGAMFFDLSPRKSVLSDSNEELINCYQVVRTSPQTLVSALSNFQVEEKEYYRMRAIDPQHLSKVERAARFIYLNKTCFNGLHRVNKQGKFNTPFGHLKKANLVDEENLFKASKLLASAEIFCINYFDLLTAKAEAGDFIYLDPPYLPIGKNSDFKRYTKNFFYEENHETLASLFKTLDHRGCKLLLSNSYHPRIEELYRGYRMQTVQASRSINCRGDKRGAISERIISNF